MNNSESVQEQTILTVESVPTSNEMKSAASQDDKSLNSK
jgi:hypothetical protein